eukprot:2521613-Pleurochrysis_carterae.AAC.1
MFGNSSVLVAENAARRRCQGDTALCCARADYGTTSHTGQQTGEKCTRHSRDGRKGYGTKMMHKQREKRMGREEKRERGRMELNIG